jgi:hypothetical protein
MTQRTLYVDSTYRDVTLYPNGSEFTLHLADPVKNISRVDLVAACVPHAASASDFIFLDILELRTPDTMCAQALPFAGSSARSSFGLIQMDVPVGAVKSFKEQSDFRMSATYPQPIDTLSRLTIKWLDASGKPLDLQDNSFVLRLHTVKQVAELPPPPPMLEVELKRIVDALALAPAPPEPEKKLLGRWTIWILAVVFALGYMAYRTIKPSA